jgi:hypothetical protein
MADDELLAAGSGETPTSESDAERKAGIFVRALEQMSPEERALFKEQSDRSLEIGQAFMQAEIRGMRTVGGLISHAM